MDLSGNARKALVSLAIEKTLLETGGMNLLDKVAYFLLKEYNSYIPDCYEHPEYLSTALKSIFGDAHSEIIRAIKKYLGEFIEQKPILYFIEKLAE